MLDYIHSWDFIFDVIAVGALFRIGWLLSDSLAGCFRLICSKL